MRNVLTTLVGAACAWLIYFAWATLDSPDVRYGKYASTCFVVAIFFRFVGAMVVHRTPPNDRGERTPEPPQPAPDAPEPKQEQAKGQFDPDVLARQRLARIAAKVQREADAGTEESDLAFLYRLLRGPQGAGQP